jgi:hypothetical protein
VSGCRRSHHPGASGWFKIVRSSRAVTLTERDVGRYAPLVMSPSRPNSESAGEAPTENQPTKRRKLGFWILAGMMSVLFVEVPTGSTMFPFFTIWGMLVVLPLYLMHIVFLAAVVFRFGRPNFWTLYTAGVLFGMYEAYITKVLWISFRPEGPFLTAGGIALFETILLVLCLHPLLAFVVPLLFTEMLCTNSSEVVRGLPAGVRASILRRRWLWLILLMAFLGFMQFVNSPSVVHSFLSSAGNGVVMGLALLWWRKSGGAAYSLRQLLPGHTGLRIFGALLLGWYLFWGLVIKPEAIPAVIPGQLTIWLIYAGACLVFFRCLRRSPGSAPELLDAVAATNPPLAFSWRGFVLACAVATAVTSASRLLLFPFAPVQALLMLTFFVVTGLALLAGDLVHAFRPRT